MAANDMIAPCQPGDASSAVWRPSSEDVFRPGDRMDIFFRAWPAEGIVPGSAYVCSIFLLSARHKDTADFVNVTVLDHGSFTYAPEPRRDLGDHCEDLNSTYTWTIPEDIDVREPQFRIVVVDGVNLDVLAASDSFHIRSDNVGSGGDGTDVPTITTLALPGLPEGTYSPGFQPGEGAVEPAGAGFSTGVRAALGVGVGILVVVLALGVLLIRRRRFDLCTRRARLRGKMCHIAELEDSPPRRKDDRVATKEKVYELPGTPVD